MKKPDRKRRSRVLWRTRPWPALARTAIANGATGTLQISAALGIDRTTFYRWQRTHPEFAAAVGQPNSDRTSRSAFHKRNFVRDVWAARDRLYMRHHRQVGQHEVIYEIGVTGDKHRRWWHQFPAYRAAFDGLPWGKGSAAAIRKITRKVLDSGELPPKKPNQQRSFAETRAAWRPDWKRPQIPDRVLRRIVKETIAAGLPFAQMVAEYDRALKAAKQ